MADTDLGIPEILEARRNRELPIELAGGVSLHVATMIETGLFAEATEHLDHLRELDKANVGIDCIDLEDRIREANLPLDTMQLSFVLDTLGEAALRGLWHGRREGANAIEQLVEVTQE